jgi:hypothetical protein
MYCAPGAPAGVYPMPDTATTPQPFAVACSGQPFNFTFTVVVPDSITSPFPLNLTTIELTGLGIYSSGTTVGPLPGGLTYSCYSPQGAGATDLNPNDCIFSDRSCGCVKISGTVPSTLTAGDYEITILCRINSALNLSFGQNIPGTLHPVSGHYILRVASCVGVETVLGENVTISANQPNPFAGITNIVVESNRSTELGLNITNTLGQIVSSRQLQIIPGTNTVTVDGSELANGIYFYSFTDGTNIASGKMIVQH